jgi:hypothetical protein
MANRSVCKSCEATVGSLSVVRIAVLKSMVLNFTMCQCLPEGRVCLGLVVRDTNSVIS